MLIRTGSTEHIRVPVTAPAGTDLASLPVRIAVVAHHEEPADEEWHEAHWTDAWARLLVGPNSSTQTLPRGAYQVWINIDPPGSENVVRLSGPLLVA
ncbi:hypothetical protein [Streptomyces sp. NPDC052114]|uniref:hypothetical protein n=1 Tax=unclassified Streptomyces TaxID=2593676 RepID=UPI003437EB3C